MSHIITSVDLRSPAQKAGIVSGDTVVSIDGKEMGEWNDLIDAIREGGIAIGGKEREFQKKHKKRYWLATTLGFIALNRTLSLAHKPYRRRKAHKLGLYHMDKDGNR